MKKGPDLLSPRGFGPGERIRRRPEFQRVHEQGNRISGRLMTAVFLANSFGHDRLGIIASRKIGGAVARNRAKRLIREAFRLNRRPADGGFDIIVIPRAQLANAPYREIEAEYRSILQRHGKRARS